MDRGVARIVIIVVLAVVGGLVLANGFDDGDVTAAGSTPSPSTSGSASPTVSGSTSPTTPPAGLEPQPPEEVTFMALNATSVTGLAAEAELVLLDAGYVSAGEPDNAPTQGAQETSVLYRGGDGKAQNKANAKLISKDYFPGSPVALLSPDYDDVVPPEATVVVVTGQDFADEIAA